MRNFITPIGEEYPFGGPGKFILGTVQAMAEQLRQEYANTVDLIYIDPPFGTGDGFSVKLPGMREKVKIPAYSDNMDIASYLEMMRGVLTLCHDLLKDTGSVYVHIDYRMCARIRLMLDEIFGESCFQNEIIWAYKSGGRSVRHYSRKHDNILFYRKSAKAYDESFKKIKNTNIQKWGYYIQLAYPNIESITVLFNRDYPIYPWRNWKYEKYTDKKGALRYKLANGKETPFWWIAYNDIKHERTSLSKNGKTNYAHANQKNLIYSFAALFVLEMLYLDSYKGKENQPYTESKMFNLQL